MSDLEARPVPSRATVARFTLELGFLVGLGILLTLVFALFIYPALGWPPFAPMPLRTIALSIAAWFLIRSAGERLADFGLGTPRPIWVSAALVLGYLSVKLFVAQPLSDAITDWLDIKRGDHSFFNHLHGNVTALIGWFIAAWLAGGLGEEFLFRGYLMKRVADAFGGGTASWLAALLLQASIFGAMHFYLGAGGVISTSISAVFFGAFFLLSRRNLWPVIFVHGLWDSLALFLIYSTGAPTT